SIQQPVPRVRHADLAFAEEVVAAKDRRRPQYRVAVAKGVRIEIAHRKMVGAEIIEREDAAGGERNQQGNKERGRTNANGEPKWAHELRRMGDLMGHPNLMGHPKGCGTP